MSFDLGAVLIAEVGSLTTRVTLVDTVEGETRLIAQAEAPTSSESPYEDVLIGVLEATVHVAELSGRQLLREGRLFKPQNSELDGINHLIVTTSAAGNLELIIAAIARDVSANSAQRAARSTYTNILQVVTLDDAAMNPELQRTTSWVERQVQTMLDLRPDAVLMAGGLEGGAREVLCRLARVVAFALAHMSDEGSRQRRTTARPVIYAGNSDAQDCVQQAIGQRAELSVVENIRPTLDEEHLETVRRAMARLYERLILPKVPGMDTLKELCSIPVTTVCKSEGLITRFLAERYERHLLSIQVGSTSSSAMFASPGHFAPAILGVCGTGYGLMAVVRERGLHAIGRWLPFAISDQDLMHWLLNKQMRPHLIPSSREDVLIEQAVAHEALGMVLEALQDDEPAMPYDMVIAGGGVLAHAPHPGLAALTILDVLQPYCEESDGILELRLDVFGMMAACGVLAHMDADSALTLFERDVLRNVPLASCVVPLGEGKPGDVAIEAELVSRQGGARRVQVRHGEIARLPLPQGAVGQLKLRPAAGVRVGRNEPGAETTSDIGALSGSALGIVIDARGRPLRLPQDSQQRMARLQQWLAALEAKPGEQHTMPPMAEPDMPTFEPIPPAPAPAASGGKPDKQGAPIEPTPEPAEVAEAPDAFDLPPLEDIAAASQPQAPINEPQPPTSQPASQPQKGRRISLADEEVPAASEPQPPASQSQKGRRISLAELEESAESSAQPQPKPEETDRIQDDLAALRQTVDEEPKKRGWFGRKKKK
jgi:hypothetical protein